MSFDVDALFRFERIEENGGGYILADFTQVEFWDFLETNIDDDLLTEVTVPAKYKEEPVVEIGKRAFSGACELEKITIPEGVRRIGENAFWGCDNLRSVSLPASLEEIEKCAFKLCTELREVEFRSSPNFDASAFAGDLKLPAELVLTWALGSRDLTRAFYEREFSMEITTISWTPQNSWLLVRPDVFALALKNGCFRLIGTELRLQLFKHFIEHNCTEQLRIAEDYAKLNAAQLGELIEYSVQQKNPEITAYLLELKKRKFGFNKDGDLEL